MNRCTDAIAAEGRPAYRQRAEPQRPPVLSSPKRTWLAGVPDANIAQKDTNAIRQHSTTQRTLQLKPYFSNTVGTVFSENILMTCFRDNVCGCALVESRQRMNLISPMCAMRRGTPKLRSDQSSGTATLLIPELPTLPLLRDAAAGCRACELWRKGTQTVFGEGSGHATVMLIGEQPGDKEDLADHPFVGPAGRILNEALEEAGIDRSKVYVTNIVKHFSWIPDQRGKRRIHKKPKYSEIKACRPWLDAEISVIRPKIVICLGATAAQGLLGREFSVMRARGKFVSSKLAPFVLATVHPSSILRAQGYTSRREQKQSFVNDLRVAAEKIRDVRRAA